MSLVCVKSSDRFFVENPLLPKSSVLPIFMLEDGIVCLTFNVAADHSIHGVIKYRELQLVTVPPM